MRVFGSMAYASEFVMTCCKVIVCVCIAAGLLLVQTARLSANELEDAIQTVARSDQHHALAQGTLSGSWGSVWGRATQQAAIDGAMQRCIQDEAHFTPSVTSCQIVVLDGYFVNRPQFTISIPVDVNIVDGVSGRTTDLRGSIVVDDFYERRPTGVVVADGREICNFDMRWRASDYRVSVQCLGYGTSDMVNYYTPQWTFEFEQSTLTLAPNW